MSVSTITQELRKSGRVHRQPIRYGFLIGDEQTIEFVDSEDPATYQEVIESPDSAKWLGAMEAEMQSMYDNQVWRLADPP